MRGAVSCGRVLNDAARYINERMLPFVSSYSYAVEADMETLFGKLRVAQEHYAALAKERLSLESIGAL